MFSETAGFYDLLYSFKDYAEEAARVAATIRSVHAGAQSILDVACGTGAFARAFAEAVAPDGLAVAGAWSAPTSG